MCDNKILEVINCDLVVIGVELIDVKGMYVVFGGVEIYCYGGGGGDFMEGMEEVFCIVINVYMKYGIISIFLMLFFFIVLMIEVVVEICIRLMVELDSLVFGFYFEGYYFNMKMVGGQMFENIKDLDLKEYIFIVEKWGCIKCWDVVFELLGVMQFGKYIIGKGILVFVVYIQVEYEDICVVWEFGYFYVIYFYNVMLGFYKCCEYKYEGIVESIYLIDDMIVEVVVDGIYVFFIILCLIYKIKGVECVCVIIDVLVCVVSESNVVFDFCVIIEDGVCKLVDCFVLVGSVVIMDCLICILV